jgi:hypothetical protein
VSVIGFPIWLLPQFTVPVQPTAFTETLVPIQTVVEGRLMVNVGVRGTAFTVNLSFETGLTALGLVAETRILKLEPVAKEVGMVAVKEPLPLSCVGKLTNCPLQTQCFLKNPRPLHCNLP